MATSTHNVNASSTYFLNSSDTTFLDNSLEFMSANWGKITTVTLLATVIWDRYKNDSRMINAVHKFLNDVFGFSATQAENFVKNHPVATVAAFISADMLLHEKYNDTFTYIAPKTYKTMLKGLANTTKTGIDSLHNAFHSIKNPFSNENKNVSGGSSFLN
jgi:restriction endonuclease